MDWTPGWYAMPFQGMKSKTWWWITSNGALPTRPRSAGAGPLARTHREKILESPRRGGASQQTADDHPEDGYQAQKHDGHITVDGDIDRGAQKEVAQSGKKTTMAGIMADQDFGGCSTSRCAGQQKRTSKAMVRATSSE